MKRIDYLKSIKYNKENSIDARLLRVQVQGEIDKWEKEAPHENSTSIYSNLISSAVSRVIAADFLTIPDKAQIVCQRLSAIQELAKNRDSESIKKEAILI